MIKPADFDPNKKYPVIMHQYGGPGSQQVVNSWAIGSMGQGGMYYYYLAENGFIIVSVDGRGTGFTGAAGKCAAELWCEGAARSGDIQRSAAVGLF